jgi:ribosomal protein S18 acetylase RimI-like enzyme
MEQNLAGHFSWLQRGTEGMAVQDRGGLLLVNSGLPCASFNVLFCTGRHEEAALRDAVNYFRFRDLPFAAWLGPESTAAAALEGLGMRPTEVSTGMLLDRAAFLPCAPPAGLSITRITDPIHVAHFAAVLAGQPPDSSVLRFYERAQAAVLRPDDPMRLFVGYWDGQPVTTAEAFLDGGAGGVYSIATLESHRRRGFGAAMTSHAVREVFGSGCPFAALEASPLGRGIYERLGFRTACEFAVLG